MGSAAPKTISGVRKADLEQSLAHKAELCYRTTCPAWCSDEDLLGKVEPLLSNSEG